MNSSLGNTADAAHALPPLSIDPESLIQSSRRNWTKWLGSLISFAVLIAALWQWRNIDFANIWALMPVSPAFWITYLVYYFSGPISEWVIFRRLWRLPASGILPILRKKLSNELVLGYLGEVYFYTWARRNSQLTAAPFGAIKDVAILSAMAGNAVTLAMLAIGFPLFLGLIDGLDLALSQRTLAISVSFIAVTSIIVLVLRRHVLSLRPGELLFVLFIHGCRIGIGIVLLTWMWHLALPEISLLWWGLLSLLRQLVTRLPFVPNKDIIFAGLAIFFVGEDVKIVSLMALIAGLVLATHLLIGAVIALIDLIRAGRSRQPETAESPYAHR